MRELVKGEIEGVSLLGIMLSRQNAFNVFITFFFFFFLFLNFNDNLFSYLLYTLYVLVYCEGFDYKTTTRKQRHKTIGLSYKPRIMHMKRLHSAIIKVLTQNMQSVKQSWSLFLIIL